MFSRKECLEENCPKCDSKPSWRIAKMIAVDGGERFPYVCISCGKRTQLFLEKKEVPIDIQNGEAEFILNQAKEALIEVNSSETKYPFIFIDESGTSDSEENKQPYFGIGFLQILKTDKITHALLAVQNGTISNNKTKRKEYLQQLANGITVKTINNKLASTSHHEFHFTKINYSNLEQYKKFIDAALCFDLKFTGLTLKRGVYQYQLKKDHYWETYIDSIKNLCRFRIEEDNQCTIVRDYLTRPKIFKETFEDILCQCDEVNNVLTSESIGSPLIQLCDLLLGCVVYQHKMSSQACNDSRRHKAKVEFINHVTQVGLGLKDNLPLASENLYTKPSNEVYAGEWVFDVWPKYPKRSFT